MTDMQVLADLRSHKRTLGRPVAVDSFVRLSDTVSRVIGGEKFNHGVVVNVFGLPGLTEFVQVILTDSDGFDPRDENGASTKVLANVSFLSIVKVID